MEWKPKSNNQLSWDVNNLADYSLFFVQGAPFVVALPEIGAIKDTPWAKNENQSTSWTLGASETTYCFIQGASFIVGFPVPVDASIPWNSDNVTELGYNSSTQSPEPWNEDSLNETSWGSNDPSLTNWENNELPPMLWDAYRWIYLENTAEQFSKESLILLVAKSPNILRFSEDFSFCMGPAVLGDTSDIDSSNIPIYTSRLWTAFKGTDGQFYIAKSNATFDDWESIDLIAFVPSGCDNVSIQFDKTGHYVLSFQLYSAGDNQRQLWIYQYPYSGNAIKNIITGNQYESSILFMDHQKSMIYFYLDKSGTDTKIHYRVEANEYTTDYLLPSPAIGDKELLSCRFFVSPRLNKPDYYLKATVLYTATGEVNEVRYINTDALNEFPYILEDTHQDQQSVGAALNNIQWIICATKRIYPTDNESLLLSILSLNWIELLNLKKNSADFDNLSISANNINWTLLSIKKPNVQDSSQTSVSVRSILWMQVQR